MTANEQVLSRTAMPMMAHGAGLFPDMQQQVTEQVTTLGRNYAFQEQAFTPAQFTELRERTELLIAAFYEQSQHSVRIEERFERHREALADVKATVISLCEAQQQWQSTVDQLVEAMMCLSDLTGK
jgi:hypothetical protein